MRMCHFGIESLEQRQMLALHPVAINFNDEALWDENFDTAVEEAKRLGVTAVRLWMDASNYDARPNAWDPRPVFGSETTDLPGRVSPKSTNAPLLLSRIFELDREGFTILLTTQNREPPASAQQVQDFFRHLLAATETPTSTVTLRDAIDYWEINNEPDLGAFWRLSKTDKVLGMQAYVNQLLIPVADVLHEGLAPENVVLGGVSWSPNDMRAMLEQLVTLNRLDAVDYAGYHPYGTYDPRSPDRNEPLDRAQRASAFAAEFGKPLIITEWNIRDFPVDGSEDDVWVQANDETYYNAILPYAEIAFYFALIDNWDARGGQRSARPASVLTHDSPVQVTPQSTIADLKTYYASPLVRNEPFYSMMHSWGNDQTFELKFEITGTLTDSLSTGGQAPPSSRVYIDKNNDGDFDAGEPSTQTAGDGAFTLKYTSLQVSTKNYPVRVDVPDGWAGVTESVSLGLRAGNLTGVQLSVRSESAPAWLENGVLYIEGTPGNDVIGISKRSTRLRVVRNADMLTFRAASVNWIHILTGEGNDMAAWSGLTIPGYIDAGAGNDLVIGGFGNDSLTGSSGKDTLQGNAGDDRINGANTGDQLFGGDGADRIYGGAAGDYIDGGTGVDRIWGEDGTDFILGGAGSDKLYGGDDNDTIAGHNGNDLISGDKGADLLYGQAGNDSFLADDNERDTLDGGIGADSGDIDPNLDLLAAIELTT